MNTGKKLRLRRIINQETNRSVMYACSHGTTAPNVLRGIEDPSYGIESAINGGVDLVFLSHGLAVKYADLLSKSKTGLALKISASASRSGKLFQEVPTTSVETALSVGADAVVALIPFAPTNEESVIRWVAELGEKCYRLGMPFIAEAEFPNAYTEQQTELTKSLDVEYLKKSARLCVELGADVIKTNWISKKDIESIVNVVPGTPVVVAGGSRLKDIELLKRISDSLEVGAIGCSVGRNIFQHENPVGISRAICAVVHEGMDPVEALNLIK